jgi:hypothetical protein
MPRLIVILISLWLLSSSALAAGRKAPEELKDLYLGEALFYAFQEEWFDAIARLDTELVQHHGVDQPELDSLFQYVDVAEFDVGDFELAYRMHLRAGRAITAVINGNVEEEVRNEAIFRLARIYFQKDQPLNAMFALDRIDGNVPEELRDDLAFLRAQVFMANGRFTEAATILSELQNVDSLQGFAGYNLGIALLGAGQEQEGRNHLDLTGRLTLNTPLTRAIRDKSNLVLGDHLLTEGNFEGAKELFDRVRLEGPFSNRALLGSGWADASQDHFARALVPWSLLAEREVTDLAVQEAMLAVPYAYGKMDAYSTAALMYGRALREFGIEIGKLGESIKSIREGKFLPALTREELKQDANWVVRLRELPEAPETYYLIELMASHAFQEMLKNYMDLEQLRRKLERWTCDLDAFEEIIVKRREYYQPLLPEIDNRFQQLDSQMRLRLEQKERIEQRLKAMLVAPRPDFLATAEERVITERIDRLVEFMGSDEMKEFPQDLASRIRRLRGLLRWHIQTDYDRRLTTAYQNLHNLRRDVEQLQHQYESFVRIRQAATQSYQGYDQAIRRQRIRIAAAGEKLKTLMSRQGHMIETIAVNELIRRRERLEEFQIKARFAMADSFDRAARAQGQERGEQ